MTNREDDHESGRYPERRQHEMHPDVSRLMVAVQSRNDAIVDLQGSVSDLPERIGREIQDALLRSASDPAVWAAAAEALQRHARDRAGGWLLGGVKSIAIKLAWLLVAVGAIYLLGGWAAIATMLKWLFGSQVHN